MIIDKLFFTSVFLMFSFIVSLLSSIAIAEIFNDRDLHFFEGLGTISFFAIPVCVVAALILVIIRIWV